MSVLTVEDFQGNIKESTSKSFKVGNNYFAAEAIKVGTRSDGSNKYNYNLIRYDGPDLTGETKIGFLNPNTNKLDFFPTVQNIVNTHNLKPIKGLIDKNFKNSIKTLDVTDKDQNENEATSVESESTTVADVKKPAKPKARQSYETDLCYPVTLRRGSQDRLQIDVRELLTRNLLNVDENKLGVADRKLDKSIGRVFLPIPAGIQDFNGVSFQSGSLNPVELAAAQVALTGINDGVDAIGAELNSLVRGAIGTEATAEDLRKGVATYFVGQATGIGARGIFTRTENAVVNPNLELLFSGPTLRPFNFTFKMSPRDRGESIVVKKIIRLFKQSSAVQATASGLFLRSPNAYTIKFLTKGSRSTGTATTPEGLDSFDDTHDFLPKIKNCALLNCSVNYTPDGSYMTYENTSPVAYTMTLRFQELEPVFNDDYTNLDGDTDDSIGF